jgi:hypothetical protein
VLVYSPELRGLFKPVTDPLFNRPIPSIEAPQQYQPDIVDEDEAS